MDFSNQSVVNMTENASNQGPYCLDFRAIFGKECEEEEEYFSEGDDVRKSLYILFSNCNDLSEKCKKLLTEFTFYTNHTIISMDKTNEDLTRILMSKANGISIIQDEYEDKKLKPISLKKRRLPLFTELILTANLNTKTNIKSKVASEAYIEGTGRSIGYQHILHTTKPGVVSDSSSSVDLIDSDNSGSNSSLPRAKRRKMCQRASDFQLSEHESNSYFNNQVKCQVEIFILTGNQDYCETLAKHMGLILFESLLEGEENIVSRLGSTENTIYRLAHTGIIKKMMNGYNSICITTSESAWQHTRAHVKAIIYTKRDKNRLMGLLYQANYTVRVEDEILAYIEAIGKIVQESLLCNVLMETKYQVAEKAFTTVHLPITVMIPLYIVKYFAQSYVVAYKKCSNVNPVDIFEPPNGLN